MLPTGRKVKVALLQFDRISSNRLDIRRCRRRRRSASIRIRETKELDWETLEALENLLEQ